MTAKERIINLFRQNVKGRKPNVTDRNQDHDGREGNWLEEQFGKLPDADNHADFWGYELKNTTTSKTSFGDWSANRYIYRDSQYRRLFAHPTLTPQDMFCYYFGSPNPEKGNRYSWSGRPVPKLDQYNQFGQIMLIAPNLDIIVYYSYSRDQRFDKASIMPREFQRDDLIIAHWFGQVSPSLNRGDKCLREKLEDKFNGNGWFTCKKNSSGVYDRICFGPPINYNNWIELVRRGIVFFDSGMHQGNNRPYQQWRANNNFWDSMITETYN